MIKSIYIRNFKSLRNVSVTLSPLTVLIGRSGTGKTSFVQAIRFLRDYLVRRDLNVLAQMGGWEAVVCSSGAEAADNVSVVVSFDVPNLPNDFRYVLTLRARHATLATEELSVDGKLLFAQAEGQWTHPPTIVKPPPPGVPALGALYGLPEAKIAYLALTRGIGCYDFPGTVLEGGQFDLSQDTPLDDSAANYLRAFDAIANELSQLDTVKHMVAALRQLNSSLANVELDQSRSKILVSHTLDDGRILSFPLAQESGGMRRFLAHLLALHQQPQKQVLAFEEPENGIYPGALAALADNFRSIAERGQSQVLLTTHSPQLLDHFGSDSIRVVEIENGETKIGPLAPEQRESLEEKLLNAGELLTVVEPHIELAASEA